MDRWLKGIIALASTMVIVVGAIWIYDKYQLHMANAALEREREAQAQLRLCELIVKQSISGSGDIDKAISCSRRYLSLAWFEKSHKDDLAQAERVKADEIRAKAEEDRLASLKSSYFDKERSSKGTSTEPCFVSVRDLYAFGGKDALYTLPPSNEKVKAVRLCIAKGTFTEEEVRVVGQQKSGP
ncbi:hypothetical protein [Brucella sp. BO2]|uniref:hypothetical protein n=1 Tax=Brucella sp. BO2 TaxID=693750 RepID=UPI00046CD4CD|nr:hypothetical protein [Brucella sp. BO2]